MADGITSGGIFLETKTGTLSCDGKTAHLGPTPTAILARLMASPNKMVSHESLFSLMGRDLENPKNSMGVHIRNIRKALDSFNARSRLRMAFDEGYVWSSEEPHKHMFAMTHEQEMALKAILANVPEVHKRQAELVKQIFVVE